MVMEAASAIRKKIETDFDYVGDAFAREARAIHEGRSEDRGIYASATPAEVKALAAQTADVEPRDVEHPIARREAKWRRSSSTASPCGPALPG